MTQPVSRRNFLKLMGTAAGAAALAACAPAATAEPTKPAGPAATQAPVSLRTKKYTNTKVTFWTQGYGDSAIWQKDYLEALGAKRIAFVRGRWWVMEAPTGHRFCVVQKQRDQFGAHLNAWDCEL